MRVALCLVLLFGLPASAVAQSGTGKGSAGTDDEVEEVDVKPGKLPDKAPAASVARSAPQGNADARPADEKLTLIQVLGRLHPLAVHLPIAWLLLLLLVDLVTFVGRRTGWEPAGRLLLLGAMLSTLPAVATGLVRAQHAAKGDEALLALHRNVMLATAATCLVALVVRLVRRTPLLGVRRAVYLLLVTAAVGLLAFGAHQGGKLARGVDYLPF